MNNKKTKNLQEKIFLEILILISIFLISTGFFLLKNDFNDKNNPNTLGKSTFFETTVSLTIGELRFRLFGYSSPRALVTLFAPGVFDQIYANNNGYFQFNAFSFFSVNEVCLIGQDQFGRISSPVCLPTNGLTNNSEIGPVILPPTLSLDKNNYWLGDEVVLSGQTIPDTDVNLSIFTEEKSTLFSKINPIKQAEAFSLPKIEIKSDNKGNFSVSLPSSSVKKFKFFAQTFFNNHFSPESVKITLKILPWWMIIFKFFSFFWSLIKPYLLEIIILIQAIFLIVYILKRIFHPVNLAIIKRDNLSLVLKEKGEIEKYNKERFNLSLKNIGLLN